MIPDCAQWKIWRGGEVEGDVEIGDETLFIRQFETTAEEFKKSADTLVPSMTRQGKTKRVWFCKEFQDWPLLREIAKHFKTVCIETTHRQYGNLPHDFKTNFTIYLKVNFMLKEGDFICVGPPFSDEAFRIGTGKKVRPEDYKKDTKIR